MTTSQTVLAGVAELSDLLGVRRTTISQWHSRQSMNDFPNPIADLAMGPVWDQDQVVEWYRHYTPLRNMKKVGHLPEEYHDRVEDEDELAQAETADEPDILGMWTSMGSRSSLSA